MRMRIVLPIGLALVAGLGSLLLLNQVMNPDDKPAQAEETKPVIVAAVSMKESQKITEDMLQVRQLAVAMVPEQHFVEVADLVGRVLQTPVPAGWPVTPECLKAEGAGVGQPIDIPPGFRAYTIKVDEWSSVSGFVVPGSRVDVIGETPGTKTRKAKSRAILQNVTVAAMGSATSSEALVEKGGDARVPQSDRRSVTLLVKPRQVEILHAARAGRLTLALRSDNDDSVDQERLVDAVADLLPPPGPRPAPLPQPSLNMGKAKEIAKSRDTHTVWEIQGERVVAVVYVRVNGLWQRKNEEDQYPTYPVPDLDPMPQLMADTNQPESSSPSTARPDESQKHESRSTEDGK